MASFLQPCQKCSALVEPDAVLCPYCGSRNVFGSHCPKCRRETKRAYKNCPTCARPLYTACPHCGGETFADERCDKCGQSLLVPCANKRCGTLQFFENTHCTDCGRPLPKKK